MKDKKNVTETKTQIQDQKTSSGAHVIKPQIEAFIGRIFVTVLLMAFMSFSVSAGDLSKVTSQPDVDSIYNTIRNSSPEYDVKVQTVTFQNEGMNLVASLVLPVGVDNPPIVITCNGFSEDRFYIEIPGTNGEHFYERISRFFAERGIATLRIDYRGSGKSDGDYSMTTFSSQISDVLAAIEFVSTDLKHIVNKNRLGLFGHSQGGVVSSFAASQDYRVKSLAMFSAPNSLAANYSTLITIKGIKKGLNAPDGGTTVTPLKWDELDLGEVTLSKQFFEELMTFSPVMAIRDYKGPLMYVAGKGDYVVFTQPLGGQNYLDHHDGKEKLVLLPGGHEFNTDTGHKDFDDAVFWVLAWYMDTL